MDKPVEIEIFQPPSKRLRAKLATDKPDAPAVSPDMLTLMEQTVDALSDEYLAWLAEDTALLRTLYVELTEGPKDLARFAASVAETATRLKNFGGTFGFSLVSTIASSLAAFTAGRDALRPLDLSVIETHIDSLQLVARIRMKGDGGEEGERLVADLHRLVHKANTAG